MGGMAGVGVAPPPNHPPTSLAGGSTRARHPGPSIARARCGGSAILGGCLSVPLPPKSPAPPPPPDNPLQTAPSLFARYDDARESPLARARCGGGGARSLARSRARCVAVAMAFGYTARHARYARRASRALTRTSSPRIARVVTVFRSPSTHACARCALRRRSLARSLARSRACGVALAGVEVAFSYIARHARHARACTSSPRIARVITAPLPRTSPIRARGSGGGAVSFARLLARAEAEAVGLGEAVGYFARHAYQTRHVRRSSRARTRISSPLRARHHRFPSPPRTTGTRALLRRRRSLARSRACGVALAVEVAFSYIARHARASRTSRARACTSSPRIARVITAPLPRCHPCARAAAAAALSRLLARSRARRRRRWGWGRRSVTSRVTRVKHVTRVARHARARAYHHRFARVITVFRPPRARPARARCCGGGARSLARARAVWRWRWRWRWRSVTPRITRVTRARVYVITAHRARHHRPPSPMSPMRARGSGGGAVSFARFLARVEAEVDGHSHVVRASRVTRARARVIIVTALVSATPIEVRSFHRRLVFSSLFSLVFSFFVSPRAHYDETTGDM